MVGDTLGLAAEAVSRAAVAYTLLLLVLSTVILVVAAFYDRKRAREIESDRSRLPGGGQPGRRRDDES